MSLFEFSFLSHTQEVRHPLGLCGQCVSALGQAINRIDGSGGEPSPIL